MSRLSGRRKATAGSAAGAASKFNERSAGLLNKDVIALVVLWRLRYKFEPAGSSGDVPDPWVRLHLRGRAGVEAKLTPALAENLRRKRRGRVGRSRYVDETHIRVRGQWRYLYRAVDRDGVLVDVMLGEHRDLSAAKAFFRSARTVTGVTPGPGHDSWP